MNIETTFTWECSPGEEIELLIGGEYTPAQVLNEYEGFVGESITLDWIIDPTGTCDCEKCQKLESGKYISKLYFDSSEIEAMCHALLEAARANLPTVTARAQFPDLRRLLDLPENRPNKDFIC